MSFLAPKQDAAAPAAPVMPAAPPPVLAPQGTKPRPKSQNRTFLGTGMDGGGDGLGGGPSSGNRGGKTLLGS